ncbi:MAG TPA: ABC transporter permease [Casimicrobiaceae bacterium]|jgi:ABC-type nitrate/sulfonate/bicarbonate transport system permease component|nr:ABC transporter permease [Casimicrobiaceae bacterium]
MSTRTRAVVLPLIGFALVLAIWQGTVSLYHLQLVVLPPPWTVAKTLVALLGTAAFWHDVGVSLYEFVVGYAIGLVLGILLGTLMGEWRAFRQASTPVVESLRFVVPFAWIPLTILWFGTSYVGKIALVAYAVFFVMVVSTARAVVRVDPVLSRVGRVIGMGTWQLAWRVHLRAAAPTIASAARAAAAVGWIAVVAAEYIGASAGLGLMITNAASSLATPTVIAGMVVIGLIGAAVSALVGWLSRARLDY